jgi:chromate transporter
MSGAERRSAVSLVAVAREWGRIGVLGFGGPPVHVAMLRERVVQRLGWVPDGEFEDAIAATNLLPGPASTQLAIFSAWRVRGAAGAVVGGLAFILPGLIAIIALSALFLASAPPEVALAAGAGAGAAVPAVALAAGAALLGPSWQRSPGRRRWVAYLLVGVLAAALAGPWVVVALLGCGAAELIWRGWAPRSGVAAIAVPLLPAALLAATATGGTLALVWVAFKVGALSYGGGFVIIPLIEGDAVRNYGWMSDADFLNAVALGQLTPGPVVHTVAVVGYAAAGVGGALLAAAVAFAPSFALVLGGARRFGAIRADLRARAFLDGAGPAAIGAILGVSVPLASGLAEPWQFAVLAAAAVLLLALRRGVVGTLLAAAAAGVLIVALGAAVP